MIYNYNNHSDALIEDVSLKEYTNLQDWQDQIDQIQTASDAYAIPQWVLNQLGLTRADIMPKKSYSNKPSGPIATSTGDYTDKEAAGKFWGNATKKLIDVDNFHKAFDANLEDMKFDMSSFNDKGLLTDSGVYGKIKNLDPNNNATKAIKKLWGLQFKEDGKTLAQNTQAIENANQAQFLKDVQELIFGVLDKIDTESAKELIKQRNQGGSHVSYSFNISPEGKAVWSWYNDDYDWPWGYDLSLDLGYNPFTKSEAEVATDIIIAVEDNLVK